MTGLYVQLTEAAAVGESQPSSMYQKAKFEKRGKYTLFGIGFKESMQKY